MRLNETPPPGPVRGTGSPSKNDTTSRPRRSLVPEAVRQIERAIICGDYAAGDPLPAEGTLADTMGVSRTVVREAVKVLATKGLIEISQGRTARVTADNNAALAADMAMVLRRRHCRIGDIFEARKVCEIEAAGRAATAANGEQRIAMEDNFAKYCEERELSAQLRLDMEFHHLLAEASGNPVLAIILEALLVPFSGCLISEIESTPDVFKTDGHRAVLDAIADWDAEKARQAMACHLEGAEAKLRKSGLWDKPYQSSDGT